MGAAIPQFRRTGQEWHGELGPVPVALVGRTSTATMQDPVESIGRQIRIAAGRLPAGFFIARYYWDVESGGIDLDLRSRTDVAGQYAAAGIPRDGGMADLRAAVSSGNPPFAAVICENIERCGRDMYDALKLEKELRAAGIPVFASDEPIDAQASEGSTILVRRMKQGVGEYFRYNLKTQMWGGLQQYVIGGFNTGRCPYGYAEDRSIHPNPMKASMGATRARLVIDPDRGPWVTRMFEWRTDEGLSVPGIARRLTALGAPSPDGNAWSPGTVRNILANPKYTGRVVLGRTTNTGPTRRKSERKIRSLPREYWTWASDANNHPPLIDMDTWEAAQQVGRQRGNVRDPLTPAKPSARLYPFRARIRCKQCDRRMHGSFSHSRKPGETYTYYVCPTRASNPRHAADHPAHAWVGIREDVFTAALSGFLDQYAFGYDRAAQLARLIPATQAEQDQADTARAENLTRQLKQADAALDGISAEIGQLAGKTDPVSVAIRDRLTAQFSDRYDQKQGIEAELQAVEDAPPLTGNDLSLIDELPHALGLLAQAPRPLQEVIAAAFDIQCVYRPELKQATVVVTITDTTPGIIDAILTDPRTDHDSDAATSSAAFRDMTQAARTTENRNKLVRGQRRGANAWLSTTVRG